MLGYRMQVARPKFTRNVRLHWRWWVWMIIAFSWNKRELNSSLPYWSKPEKHNFVSTLMVFWWRKAWRKLPHSLEPKENASCQKIKPTQPLNSIAHIILNHHRVELINRAKKCKASRNQLLAPKDRSSTNYCSTLGSCATSAQSWGVNRVQSGQFPNK